jgi:hypothetical protein
MTTSDGLRILWLLLAVLCGPFAPASARAQRYEWTSHSHLQVNGDTVIWIRTAAALAGSPRAVPDTIEFVIRPDSSVCVLRPGPQRELPDEIGRQFRFLVAEAKALGRVRAKLALVGVELPAAAGAAPGTRRP